MDKFKTLTLKLKKGICIVTINRPRFHNTLNAEILTELSQAVDLIAEDETIRAVIVTGAGDKAFVAGTDIKELMAKNREEAQRFSELGNAVFLKLAHLRQPVIAAVNGFAYGSGLELALACDIRIASTNAHAGQPQVKYGIIPGMGGTQRLSRVVGLSKAKEYILTGRTIRADEALRVGLFNRVVEQEYLMTEALKMATDIINNAPLAVEHAKRTMDTGYGLPLEQALAIEGNNFGVLFLTEDQQEGMQAFIEKRRASFKRQ